jgi:hypothetical protein
VLNIERREFEAVMLSRRSDERISVVNAVPHFVEPKEHTCAAGDIGCDG